jgi:hypothetical protein
MENETKQLNPEEMKKNAKRQEFIDAYNDLIIKHQCAFVLSLEFSAFAITPTKTAVNLSDKEFEQVKEKIESDRKK